MSDLQIQCPQCQSALRVPGSLAGQNVRCTMCQQVLAVPASAIPQTAAPVSPPSSTTPPATSQFAPQYQAATAPAAASQEEDEEPNPRLPVPLICALVAVAILFICGGVFLYTQLIKSVEDTVAQNAEHRARATAEQIAAEHQRQEEEALAQPLPANWEATTIHGVTVRMPPDVVIREVASPVDNQLAIQVRGNSQNCEHRLMILHIPEGTRILRDQWMRNVFQYAGGKSEEIVPVNRGGRKGVRVRLSRDGEKIDPLVEVFEVPGKLIFISVTPPRARSTEAFFASTDFQDIESLDPSNIGEKPTLVTGDEARRRNLYLEYLEYASANTSRRALPGINARDKIDRLVGKINEQQVQAFLIIHGLSEKELNAIIAEGAQKGWKPDK